MNDRHISHSNGFRSTSRNSSVTPNSPDLNRMVYHVWDAMLEAYDCNASDTVGACILTMCIRMMMMT